MFNRYPYTDMQNQNIDFVLNGIKTLEETMRNFIAFNDVKFATPILHNPSIQYDKFTIVMSDIGDSYISKIAVPSGVTLDNNTYWQKVADYNAQFHSLQDTVNSMNSNSRNKVILAIGDSYGLGQTGAGVTSNSMYNVMKNNLNIPNSNFFNMSVGGAGFSTNSTHYYIDQIRNFIRDHISDLDRVTDVIIAGGYNDIGDDDIDNATTGISACINEIRSAMPHANIYIAMVARVFGYIDSQNKNMYGFINTVNAYVNGALRNGATYCINSELVMHDYSKYLGVDSIHPSADGHIALGNALAQAINNGGVCYLPNDAIRTFDMPLIGLSSDVALDNNTNVYIKNVQFSNAGDMINVTIPQQTLIMPSGDYTIPVNTYKIIGRTGFDNFDHTGHHNEKVVTMVNRSQDIAVNANASILYHRIDNDTWEKSPTEIEFFNGYIRIKSHSPYTFDKLIIDAVTLSIPAKYC